MADKVEEEPQIKQEGNLDESNIRDSGNFRGGRQDGRGFRGGRGGGSRFSGGRGGGNQAGGDRNENQNQNSNQEGGDFRRNQNSNQEVGDFRRNQNSNQEGGDFRRNQNSNQEGGDFRRRGRGGGRGGYRGGRDGQGHQDDQGGEGEMEYRSRGPIDRIGEKLNSFQGPTYELPPLDMGEKKFNGRNRLYIGNIGGEITEEDLIELFKPYGETAELFINKDKNFGFIKLDYRVNIDRAKRELDGHVLKGRNLKIRMAPNSATVKVRNLTPYVSNELLYYAFSPFGDIEKAHVMVDERGRPTGEGYIHFARKFSATTAIRKCQENCFFLTSSLQPVIVEPFELVDDAEGYPDKNIHKKNPEFMKEREAPPRLAHPGSFDYEYAQKFKVLFELQQQKEEALKKELQLETEKLIAQMEYARYEHETEMLRNQLRAREMGIERQKREWELKERRAEEERIRQEEMLKRQQSAMEARMLASQEDMTRRQQETNLFMQAHTLDSLLEQQEQVYEQPNSYSASTDIKSTMVATSTTPGGEEESKGFMSSYERQNQQSNRYDRGGHWVNENRREDYQNQNKRRRF